MNACRRKVCALLAVVSLLALPAFATSFSTDQSDLYYIPAESGWGIQLVQRGSVIFGTMFVYSADNTPTWYVATMHSPSTSTWTGDLYATTGPYFGATPFNPEIFAATKVGTMSWAAQTVASGTLNYVVNGVDVTKHVVRQPLVIDDYSGTYKGALHMGSTGCTRPTGNVPPFEVAATVSAIQNGQSILLTISAGGVVITITGALAQDGQFGTALGRYTTSVAELGNASLSAMNVQVNSLTASLSLNSTNVGCQNVGYFAGMRSRP